MTARAWVLLAVPVALASASCRDVSRFSSGGDHYEGTVVQGSFVREGIDAGSRLCLTLDADHLQDAPGSLTSSDGRFRATPLRPIPQIWHDPLSTFSFGEGRVRNLLYIASPVLDGAAEGDVTVIVSLMQSGSVEVRLLRGAPGPAGAGDSLFAVFSLSRAEGACSF